MPPSRHLAKRGARRLAAAVRPPPEPPPPLWTAAGRGPAGTPPPSPLRPGVDAPPPMLAASVPHLRAGRRAAALATNHPGTPATSTRLNKRRTRSCVGPRSNASASAAQAWPSRCQARERRACCGAAVPPHAPAREGTHRMVPSRLPRSLRRTPLPLHGRATPAPTATPPPLPPSGPHMHQPRSDPAPPRAPPRCAPKPAPVDVAAGRPRKRHVAGQR